MKLNDIHFILFIFFGLGDEKDANHRYTLLPVNGPERARSKAARESHNNSESKKGIHGH
jgi:hypothetical protein